MKTAEKKELVEVFDGTSWQAEMVKSLLKDAGIEAYIKDSIMGMLNPWWTAPGGAGAVKVFVAEPDINEAKQIVAEYEKNLNTE
jgi:hypothetical protein